MLFIAYIVLLVVMLAFSVACFIIRGDVWFNIIEGGFALLISLVLIAVLIFNPPLLHCPGCDALAKNLSGKSDFCTYCGYEWIPHCAECGEVCNTAFCKSCGAEQ